MPKDPHLDKAVAVQCTICGFVSKELCGAKRWGPLEPARYMQVDPARYMSRPDPTGRHVVDRYPKDPADQHPCSVKDTGWDEFKLITLREMIATLGKKNDHT